MPSVLGLDVSIEIEGKKVPEYKPEVSYDATYGVPVTTCWIASEAGKGFCIAVDPPPPPRTRHWSLAMKLDGSDIVVNGGAMMKTSTGVRRLREQIVSNGVVRSFQFATIQMTDDDAALHSTSADLGSISVVINSVDNYVPSRPMTNYAPVAAAGPVHERAKKAFVHRVGFGEKRECKDMGLWYTPVGKKLQAIVVFRYRNLDILVADGIAPRRNQAADSSPPVNGIMMGQSGTNAAAGPSNPRKRKASEPPVKIEIDMEEEEEKELEARLSALRAKKAKRSNGARVKTEVKSEFRPNFVDGEVIDLTEDY